MTGFGGSQLLTANEVATRWQVSTAHVYNLTREGRLPCVELGRCRRYGLGAVEAFEMAGGTSDRKGVQSIPAEGPEARSQGRAESHSAENMGAQSGEGEHGGARIWLLKPLPEVARDWIAVFFPVVQIALVLSGQLLTTPAETIQIQIRNITIYSARQPFGNSRGSERSEAADAASHGSCPRLFSAIDPVGLGVPCLNQFGSVTRPTVENHDPVSKR